MAASPKITSTSYLLHFPARFSPSPHHVTVTRLFPSSTLLLHITTQRHQARLSDGLVVSMPRGPEAVSTKLEGLGGMDDDIDRIARLLGILSFERLAPLLRALRFGRSADGVAKRLGRQCFVSGDLAGVLREEKGEVISILGRFLEEQLATTS